MSNKETGGPAFPRPASEAHAHEGDQYCDIAMIANISKARCRQIYTTHLQRNVT